MAKFQCLRTLVAELSSLENRLFLANVTMPSLFHRRHQQLKPDIPSEINSRSPCCGTTRAKTLTLTADADDMIKPPWSDGEIVKIAFGAESCAHEL